MSGVCHLPVALREAPLLAPILRRRSTKQGRQAGCTFHNFSCHGLVCCLRCFHHCYRHCVHQMTRLKKACKLLPVLMGVSKKEKKNLTKTWVYNSCRYCYCYIPFANRPNRCCCYYCWYYTGHLELTGISFCRCLRNCGCYNSYSCRRSR